MTETATPKPVRTYHHGRTPAGWAGTIIALIGFVLGSVGFVFGINWTLIIAGGAVIVASLIVTVVLRSMGYGQA